MGGSDCLRSVYCNMGGGHARVLEAQREAHGAGVGHDRLRGRGGRPTRWVRLLLPLLCVYEYVSHNCHTYLPN